MGVCQEMTLRRPYYRCPHCRASQWPWDQKIGLSRRALTPGAEQIVSLSAVKESFGLVAERSLKKLTGIQLSESTVERVAEEAGERVGKLLAEDRLLGESQEWEWQRDAEGHRCAYVSIDATGVPHQGPRGAKAEGRMAYVGMVYNANSEHDSRRVLPHQVRYLAGFYELDELGLQLRQQARHVGWNKADRWIALSDGGSGLEPFIKQHFPGAVPILDFYHASQHVAELARAWHAGDDAAFQKQMTEWCHQMKHAGGAALLDLWEQLDLTGRNAAAIEQHRLQTQYVRNNVQRMDYPTYLARGWQIGSGPVESACKTVVNLRLKGPGMRWGSPGADALCHLRALFLSEPTQWDTFWQCQQEKTHLRK